MKIHLFEIFLAGMLAVAGCHPATRNDDPNLDFELADSARIPAHWACTAKNAEYSLDNQVVQHGHGSLLISARSDSSAVHSAYQDLKAPALGDSLTFSAYLKTENLAGSGSTYFWILDEQGVVLSSKVLMEQTPLSGSNDWKNYAVTLARPPNAASMRVGIMLLGSGNLWADHLKMTVDGVPYSPASLGVNERSLSARDNEVVLASKSLPSNPTSEQLKKLSDLGELWAFLKYHVNEPQRIPGSCDRTLFRAIPSIMAAKSEKQLDSVYADLIDAFLEKNSTTTHDHSGTIHLDDPFAVSAQPQPVGVILTKPDYGHLFTLGHFSQAIQERLTFLLNHRNDPGNAFVQFTAIGNPQFQQENPFYTSFPSSSLRLLALFRFWAIIQYYYPYRPLFEGKWNNVLQESIPAVLKSSDNLSFIESFAKLIACIGDSHASISNNHDLESLKGRYLLPIHCEFIEGKLVCTQPYSDLLTESRIQAGDVIESFDGVAITALIDKWLPLTPGSNLPYRLSQLADPNGFLLRSDKEDCKVVVRKRARSSVTLFFRRKEVSGSAFNNWVINRPGFEVKNDIGFLNPSHLTTKDFEVVREQFQHTKGIIIDLRCYPAFPFPDKYGDWLGINPSGFFRGTVMDPAVPGQIRELASFPRNTASTEHYRGKLVILVNSRTISNAEFATMAFQTVPGAIVVGSQTAGADGNVSQISILNNLNTAISGIGICYPNGYSTQRTGVKIDVLCSRTIKGIRDGIDEVLQKGIELINGHRPIALRNSSLYFRDTSTSIPYPSST